MNLAANLSATNLWWLFAAWAVLGAFMAALEGALKKADSQQQKPGERP